MWQNVIILIIIDISNGNRSNSPYIVLVLASFGKLTNSSMNPF
jgi:hypothetical protein